ncbi:hypothetical protein [Pareuzebyella sediminis]|uniref:hypothetical protein n=1 Tax=Pareuzebyella sediminis TaxID=2607998 RepID=UPI0011EF5177|nr:hypothetical protein [Pareuzebyella sediminis]
MKYKGRKFDYTIALRYRTCKIGIAVNCVIAIREMKMTDVTILNVSMEMGALLFTVDLPVTFEDMGKLDNGRQHQCRY